MKNKKFFAMGMIMVCLLSGCGNAGGGSASAGGTEGVPGDSAPGSVESSTVADNPVESSPENSIEAVNPSESNTESSAVVDNPSDNPGEEVALSEEEKQFFTEFIQEMENYGFLLSDYDDPKDVNIGEVFYSGAGFGEEIPEEDISLYLEAISQEELYLDCLKLPRQGIEELLQRKLGIGLEAMSSPLDMVYLAETDAYYNQAGDTNYAPFSCTEGSRVGDTYTLHFTPAVDWLEGFGDRETVVVKAEDGYRFLSNHTLTE